MPEDLMCGWTIYARPLDFPQHYAVRMWMVGEAGGLHWMNVACLCRDLEEARQQIPQGTIRFGREEGDDPTICETYI